MKKLITLGLALSLFTASIAAPKRAEALLAGGLFIAGGVPLVVVGGVLSGGSVTCLSWGGWAIHYGARNSGLVGAIQQGIGLMSVVAGVLLLDGDSGQDLVFAPVSLQDGLKMGLTPEEAKSFNAELSEVNAVRESIQSEVVSEVQGGKPLADVDVHAKWESYRDALSPVTFAALEKVSAHVTDQLKSVAR